MLRAQKLTVRSLLALFLGVLLAACGSEDPSPSGAGTDAPDRSASDTASANSTATGSSGPSATSSTGATSAQPPTDPSAGNPPGQGAPTFVPGVVPNLQPATMTIKNWQAVDLCSLLTPADVAPAFGDLGGPAVPMQDNGCGFPSATNAIVVMGILTLADLVEEAAWADPSTVQAYSIGGNDAWVSCGTEDLTCISYVMVDAGNAFGVVGAAEGMSLPDLQANVVSLLQIAFDRLPNG